MISNLILIYSLFLLPIITYCQTTPTPTTTPATTKKENDNTKTYFGLTLSLTNVYLLSIVGFVFLLFVCLIIVVCCWRRRINRRKMELLNKVRGASSYPAKQNIHNKGRRDSEDITVMDESLSSKPNSKVSSPVSSPFTINITSPDSNIQTVVQKTVPDSDNDNDLPNSSVQMYQNNSHIKLLDDNEIEKREIIDRKLNIDDKLNQIEDAPYGDPEYLEQPRSPEKSRSDDYNGEKHERQVSLVDELDYFDQMQQVQNRQENERRGTVENGNHNLLESSEDDDIRYHN